MNVILSPDSFKGSLSATEVCDIIEDTIKCSYPDSEITKIPIADGGEGTVDAFLTICGGKKIYADVKSPLGHTVSAYYGLLEDNTAVIEMAQASGLTIEEKNNALLASTYGTGELILSALDHGCTNILIGIGGSATTDGGVGCVQALGGNFFDKNGNEIKKGGLYLADINEINVSAIDKRLKNTKITVLCDVKNPLYGQNGAAYVYSRQKGADDNDVIILDQALKVLAIESKKALGEDYSSLEGAGAAGGLGFGLVAFLGAELKSGIDVVLDTANFEEKAKSADLIITGEGKMDSQSLMGKAPFGVASRSKGTEVVAIVGLFDADIKDARANGISDVFETNPNHLPFEEILPTAKEDLKTATKKMIDKILAKA